jgi:3-oxoacyl-[acyl-carrier protein] reductase
MNVSLENKNALVCGASRGIGKAIAIELSRLGASVTVMARNTENLKEVLAELYKEHPAQDHQFLVADFQEQETVLTRVKSILTQKNFHILINNSGGPKGGPILQAQAGEFSAAFHQHIIFSHKLTQLLLEGMKKDHYGRIVNIISTSVKEPIPGLGVSNTIRGAMGNWAKSMAIELGAQGITINNLLPGYTNTQRLKEIIADKAAKTGKTESEIAKEMMSTVPMGRFAEPQEIAHAVGFLVSPSAGYITGVNLPVDGGRTKSL